MSSRYLSFIFAFDDLSTLAMRLSARQFFVDSPSSTNCSRRTAVVVERLTW